MNLSGERLIPAPLHKTWAALNDTDALKACIAGCETLERTSDDAFVAVVAVKIGPVSARFKGDMKLTQVQPPTSYTINFNGQGGAAGFGKGSADVALAAEGEQTRLKYTARAQVGGKMAQVGAAAKVAEDFFKAFENYLQPATAPVASSSVNAASAASPAPAVVVGSAPTTAVTSSNRWLWWGAVALVLIATVYFLAK
jgi:carbon monoxide dehydrogenase subunit G